MNSWSTLALTFFVNRSHLWRIFVRSDQSASIFCNMIVKSFIQIEFFAKVWFETPLSAGIRVWKSSYSRIHVVVFTTYEKKIVFFTSSYVRQSLISKAISLGKDLLENRKHASATTLVVSASIGKCPYAPNPQIAAFIFDSGSGRYPLPHWNRHRHAYSAKFFLSAMEFIQSVINVRHGQILTNRFPRNNKIFLHLSKR